MPHPLSLCPAPLQVVTGNRIWKQRVVDIGVVTAQQAMDWGFRSDWNVLDALERERE